MSRRHLTIFLSIILFIVVSDQISKLFILKYLQEGQSVSIIGDLLYFQFIFNEGGAMGTRIGPSWLYTIITIIALGLILRYFITERTGRFSTGLALSLISGGAIGNLVDRIRFGKVIDFVDLDFPDIRALDIYRWFTFNIADAAITVGLVIFIISLLARKNPRSGPDNPEGDSVAAEIDIEKR